MRISKPDLFLEFAHLAAQRSTCPRGHVGAVLVRDDHPISIGYNGALPGMPHCDDEGCDIGPDGGCQRTAHAEANAIAFAARYGISAEGCDLYCTHSPCVSCAKVIASAGVKSVVFRKPYRDPAGRLLLLSAKILVVHLEAP